VGVERVQEVAALMLVGGGAGLREWVWAAGAGAEGEGCTARGTAVMA
jgi:hypothetical protein